MAGVAALESLLATQTLWHAGRAAAIAADGEPTGYADLDALLPQRGWPRRALTELLLPADGVGELSLLLPTLGHFTRAGATVVLVAPPYLPYAPAWQAVGVDLLYLEVIDAAPRDALWTSEQCLRSGAARPWSAGRCRPTPRRCAGCRWRWTAGRASASRCATHRPTLCRPMRNCTACPTSRSCAVRPVPRNCSCAPRNAATQHWRSPTSARWPASCAAWKPRAPRACRWSSAASSRLFVACGACCWSRRKTAIPGCASSLSWRGMPPARARTG